MWWSLDRFLFLPLAPLDGGGDNETLSAIVRDREDMYCDVYAAAPDGGGVASEFCQGAQVVN